MVCAVGTIPWLLAPALIGCQLQFSVHVGGIAACIQRHSFLRCLDCTKRALVWHAQRIPNDASIQPIKPNRGFLSAKPRQLVTSQNNNKPTRTPKYNAYEHLAQSSPHSTAQWQIPQHGSQVLQQALRRRHAADH